MGSGTELADFRNYQYYDWKESQLGITATYTNPGELVSVNKIAFKYYVWRDGSKKADLKINISIEDQSGNVTQVDEFTILKDTTSSWVEYEKYFEECNFYKLVIKTKSELVEGLDPNTGINTRFLIGNVGFSYPRNYHFVGKEPTSNSTGYKDFYKLYNDESIYFEKPVSSLKWVESNEFLNLDSTHPAFLAKNGSASIQTTSATGWEVKSNAPARIDWNVTMGSGSGLAEFRNYQYNDWKESQLGITATYTNPGELISVNKVGFRYYLWREGSPSVDLVIKVSIEDQNGNVTKVDEFTISKNTASSWVDYEQTFATTNYKKLIIETKNVYVDFSSGQINNHFYVNNVNVGTAK